MSGGVAFARLTQERKAWRKDHPFGFVAKPATAADGSTNYLLWKCLVPGKKGSDWEGGQYPVELTFSEDYPVKPPSCHFPAGFFHPNVYDSGKVCLSIVGEAWRPSITVRQILVGIQELLVDPNNADPAQATGYEIYKRNRPKYNEMVKQQAKKYSKTTL